MKSKPVEFDGFAMNPPRRGEIPKPRVAGSAATLGNETHDNQTPTGFHNAARDESPNHVEPRWGSDDILHTATQRALRDAGLWNVTPAA